MLDHDQLTPEEAQEQNQPLIRDLSRYYDTRAEDSASLAQIRARLLQRAAGPLPVTDDNELTQLPLLLQARRERDTRMKFMQNRLRHPYLNALIAAMLLIALVGSFVLVLRARQATGSPVIARTWHLLAEFSGTGNRTITRLNIEVGQKYGSLLTCTNGQGSWVTISIGNEMSSSGQCSGVPQEPLRPDSVLTSPVAFAPVHTIKVTAPASTSWRVLLLKGTYHPPLTYTPEWHPLDSEMGEVDGTGGTMVGVYPTAILPRTWALEFVCYGTGDFKINLQKVYLQSPHPPSEIASYTAPCNGQTNFDVSDGIGQGSTPQIQITTDANNDWQALLLSCANNKPHCGATTQTPTPTP